MKCVICNGPDIVKKDVEEEIRHGSDLIFVPGSVLVCENCGEKYYDRLTIKKLEQIERDIAARKIKLKEVGHVLKTA